MMNHATIRAATPADIPALDALVQRAYRGDAARGGWTHEADLLDGQRIDRAGLDALLADPAVVLLVADAGGGIIADAGGGIIGCVEMRDKGAGTASLGLLSVDPALQAGGLGKTLIAAAEAAAEARGATRMEMTVLSQRAELIAYYQRRGYAPNGEERPFYNDVRFGVPRTGLKFVVLDKSLTRDAGDQEPPKR